MMARHVWLIVLLLAATSAAAEQALVRNLENTALEVGQGYLTHYDGVCYLLLPVHVVEEAGETAALLGEGVAPLLGETDAVNDLGDDVALAVVRGGLSARCGYSAMSVSRAVARTIRDNGLATIRSVNGDGTVAQVSVSLFDDDGERFLRIQPTNTDNQLRKGQSGSLLVVGDKPIGMLLSVDARYGVGKVIRMDAMLAKFDNYVRGRAVPVRADAPAGTATPTTGAQTVPGQPLTLLSWNTLPVSEAERPINLLTVEEGPGWRARVAAWPVELEFSVGEERMAIRGLRLEAGAAPPAMLPASVEVFVSSTEGRDRWRSLYGGSLAFEDGAAEVLTAPTWARKIRLVISASADDPGQVAFDRLRVLAAD
jgi:hypothetical protein